MTVTYINEYSTGDVSFPSKVLAQLYALNHPNYIRVAVMHMG